MNARELDESTERGIRNASCQCQPSSTDATKHLKPYTVNRAMDSDLLKHYAFVRLTTSFGLVDLAPALARKLSIAIVLGVEPNTKFPIAAI